MTRANLELLRTNSRVNSMSLRNSYREDIATSLQQSGIIRTLDFTSGGMEGVLDVRQVWLIARRGLHFKGDLLKAQWHVSL